MEHWMQNFHQKYDDALFVYETIQLYARLFLINKTPCDSQIISF
jgi:hypothetical protein